MRLLSILVLMGPPDSEDFIEIPIILYTLTDLLLREERVQYAACVKNIPRQTTVGKSDYVSRAFLSLHSVHIAFKVGSRMITRTSTINFLVQRPGMTSITDHFPDK